MLFLWIILGLVVLYVASVMLTGRRIKEYTNYMANNDVIVTYYSLAKHLGDYWGGFTNYRGMRLFRDINGKRVWVSERFTIKIVENELAEERAKWIKEHEVKDE